MIHAEHADNAVLLNDLSGRVIGCAFTVLNTLGVGFLEKVYENSLAIELREAGLAIVRQPGVRVVYHSMVVGEYFPDLLVENVLLVELKVVRALDDTHRMPTGCNVPIISKQLVYSSACCSISANHVWKSNAWSTASEPPELFACSVCIRIHPR
jgi:GxxExxY protein